MQTEERKRKRRCQFDCKDHIFCVQTLKANSSRYDIKVPFCPKFQRDPLPPEHIYPEYNNDGKFYTSAFILGVDKRILTKNEQQELMDHQKQIRDSLEKHNQLIFPRPNSKHSLCSVCKEHYKNYYFHIGSQEHRERISLSAYNNHIKQICYLYLDLWDGCEERADQEAEKRAEEEEERKLRMVQVNPLEEYSNSLLDCQRGEDPEDPMYEEQGDAMMGSKATYARRPSSRSVVGNDDTIPIMGRNPKRSNPEMRSLYEPAMRKRYSSGQFNPSHAARERKERNFERERIKMMKGTEFQKYKKDFVTMPMNESDVFLIMRSARSINEGYNLNLNQISQMADDQLRKAQDKIIKKGNEEAPHQQSEHAPIQETNKEDSESQSESEILKDIENARKIQKSRQMSSIQEGELSQSSSDDYDFFQKKTEKVEEKPRYEKPPVEKQEWKVDPRTVSGYNYPYHSMPMLTPHLPANQPNTEQPNQDGEVFKTANNINNPRDYKIPAQGYKGVPPSYYYAPYGYPPMYDPQLALHPQKGYQNPKGEKQKGKNHQKGYQYQYPYPWPYHPYYMPPMQAMPPSGQPSQQNGQNGQQQPTPPPGKGNPNNPYVGSTSININFPMYMCPPPHHSMQSVPYAVPSSRYPMPSMINPYMGYQYSPYMNQQDRNRAENEYHAGQTQANQGQYSHSNPHNPHNPSSSHNQHQGHQGHGQGHAHSHPQPHGQNPSQGNHQGGHQNNHQGHAHQPNRNNTPHPSYYYPQHYMPYQNHQQQQKSLSKKDG